MQVYDNMKCRLVDSIYKNISPFTIPSIITLQYITQNCNTQHVMLRLSKQWRENLDKKLNVVGGVIMDLYKAFDCVPHDLLLAKITEYGVDESYI